MAMDLQAVVLDLCSWCGRRIGDDEERIPLGAPLELDDDGRALMGKAVELSVAGFVLTGFLFTPESDEKREGFDLGLIACCDECADKAVQYAGTRDIELRPLSEATVRLKMLRA
jgi:hypothetical protein